MSRSASDSILSVYSDARAEYTKQLCIFLVPAYFQFFTELLQKAKDATIQEPKRVLWQFQNYLNEIHDWNMEKVNNEIHTIHANSGCDYLEELLTAVFIAHTKVLTAIRISANNKKIEINIPKVEHFLFKVLCETSKLLWSSSYLFRDGISGIEKQQNYRQVEQLINDGILQAVRSLIPVKSILKDFVNADTTSTADDNANDSDDENEHTEHIEHKQETTDVINNTVNEMVNHKELETDVHGIVTDIPNIHDIQKLNIQSESPAIPELKDPTVAAEKELKDFHETPSAAANIEMMPPPTIVIDDKPTVRFGEFNAVFNTDNPHESEMVYDSHDDTDNDHFPAIDILDDSAEPLTDGIDFDTLDDNSGEAITADEYEELS
jgi:hypothetical protein